MIVRFGGSRKDFLKAGSQGRSRRSRLCLDAATISLARTLALPRSYRQGVAKRRLLAQAIEFVSGRRRDRDGEGRRIAVVGRRDLRPGSGCWRRPQGSGFVEDPTVSRFGP